MVTRGARHEPNPGFERAESPSMHASGTHTVSSEVKCLQEKTITYYNHVLLHDLRDCA